MHWIISLCLTVAVLLILLLVFVIYVLHKRQIFFKKNGIPYLGARIWKSLNFFLGKGNLFTLETAIYNDAREHNSPIVGLTDIFGMQSVLYVTDLNLVKNIFVKDFDKFVNRRPFGAKGNNGFFTKVLFFMEGDHWKGVRCKLSPAFTSGKLRRMFAIFNSSSEKMNVYLKSQMKFPSKKNMDIDLAQIFPKYAMDVIASCAFGVNGRTWEVAPAEKSTFEKMGSKLLFQMNAKMVLKFLFLLTMPKLANWLGIDLIDKQSESYFTQVIKDVVKRRRQTGERREDFLQLMLDAQQGLLKNDEESHQVLNGMFDTPSTDKDKIGNIGISPSTPAKLDFDDGHVVTNAVLFIMAGLDGTHTILLYICYMLALHSNIQDKVYQEVATVMEKHEGQLTYDAVAEMSYLEMVLTEVLRYFGTTPRAERVCSQDYSVPGTDFVIAKNSVVLIPVYGFHHDDEYFPDPEKFIPERFTQEAKSARHPYAYMPFGHGPRNCIGMRFALVEIKAAAVKLIQCFRFSPCSKTKVDLEFDRSAAPKPVGGLWLNIACRE